ncbi:hypothetical protein LK09_05195 [Microbacterium mangrovi]|uniref:Endolytic murein transglycosylase n=1 Tax=Microbacterium mangrovi TaxID=1348253 RepID=A0A0B2A5N5_9MICO|nr:endolytic transglycosylase MltG [Microbacterium mangrovi]KHK98400.1 hypothetical protein LK09_05195 [Microbacterium mangrovi]
MADTPHDPQMPESSTPTPDAAARPAPAAPGSRRAAREAAARAAAAGAASHPVDPAAAHPATAASTPAAPAPDAGAASRPAAATRPAPQNPHRADPPTRAFDFSAEAPAPRSYAAQDAPAMARESYHAALATAERPVEDDAFAQLLSGEDHAVDDVQWITPQPPRKRRRWIGWTITLAVIVALVLGGVWVWNTYTPQLKNLFGTAAPADYPAGKAHGEAIVTVNSGDIPSTISSTLYKAGVTKSSNVFYQMLLDTGQNPTFYPGVYKLQKEMTAKAALSAMADSKNRLDHSVVLPEGLTQSQILQRVSTGLNIKLADLQAAVKNPKDYGVDAPSLEGWLFPALYTFNPGTSAHDVIKTMVDRMKQELSDAGVAAPDQQKILTIASIVQREARQAQDFPKVARVIDNRLAQGMKLQMDSTAQYGYGSLHNGTASSSSAALNDPNPWNTYVHTGLPKGPISSPGAAAIAAALNPAAGNWLYFVTVNMNTGQTVFSSNYADHQKAISQMQAWCKANPNSGC